MAKQTINNGESGLDVRTKLNANFTECYDELDTHEADTSVHGVSGNVVGTSDSQTLTNKTIDVDSNTISNIEVDNFKTGVLITNIDDVVDDTELLGARAVKDEFSLIKETTSNNLLPDSISLCKDSSLFTNSNTTDSDDSDNAKYGKYATKITLTSTTGDISYDVLDLMDSDGYYAVIMEAKNGDLSGSGIRLDVNCVGDVTTNPSAYITSTDYTRKAILLQPSDFNGASAVEIEVELDGSSSEYAYLDNLTLRKITKKEYDEGETALLAKYPFASSKGIETNEEIVSLGDDLYDGMLDVYLEGRSLVNLLDDDVAGCEDYTVFAYSSATGSDDSTEKLEGTNCTKITLTGTLGLAYVSEISKLDTSKHYLVTAHLKNGDLSNEGIRLNVNTDDTDVVTDYVTSTTWTRVGVVVQPSDFDTAAYFFIQPTLRGAIGEYGYIDAIQLNEITAEDYNNADANGASVLFPKYPYHRGLTSVEVGRIKSVGKNLLNLFGYEIYSGGDFTVIGANELIENPDIANRNGYILKKVERNTNYSFSFLSDNSTAQIGVFNFDASTTLKTYTTSGGSFDSGENDYVRIYFRNGANIQITRFFNIQLELGSSATTYEPYKESQFYLPLPLRGGTNNADSFRAKDGRHDKRNEEYTLLSADIDSVADGTNLQRAVIGLDAFTNIVTQTTGIDKATIVSHLISETDGYDTVGDAGKWYTDASNLYILAELGTWADVAAARTALTSTVTTKIVYELDSDSYVTTYYPQSVLNAHVNGTIYNENVALVEATYDSGLSVDNTDLPLSFLDYIYKLEGDVWTPVDISTATFSTGDTDFTLSAGVDGERYRFAYRPLFGSITAKMYYDYCTSTKAQADGLSEQVVELDNKINTINSRVETNLYGLATYDPASLADGAGVTTTVTVTGAELGDFAIASFSLAQSDVSISAWVSADDTVSVRFQNESGGTVDLGSGTLRAKVIKV